MNIIALQHDKCDWTQWRTVTFLVGRSLMVQNVAIFTWRPVFVTSRYQWRAEVWWCPGRQLDCVPPNSAVVLSSGVWWSLMLTGYTLFVTPKYDVIFTSANHRFGEVDKFMK